jgi:hypothetical protein
MHVQMPFATCTCSVLSHSVTIDDLIVDRPSGVTAAGVLHRSVQTAQHSLLRGRCDLASVNEMLANLLSEFAPVYDDLARMAVDEPGGPVAVVLGHLRDAFGHAARGRPDPAVSSVVTAAAMAFRLADDATLDRTADQGRWR